MTSTKFNQLSILEQISYGILPLVVSTVQSVQMVLLSIHPTLLPVRGEKHSESLTVATEMAVIISKNIFYKVYFSLPHPHFNYVQLYVSVLGSCSPLRPIRSPRSGVTMVISCSR